MKSHLTLRSERLVELTSDDLASVAAAATTTDCFTGYYPSINAPCTTLLRPLTPVIDPPASATC
jgi:hypothetical protein